MVTKKVRNFSGLILTFLGMVVCIYNLIGTETIPGYIIHSVLLLICFCGFLSFLYDIVKKKEK